MSCYKARCAVQNTRPPEYSREQVRPCARINCKREGRGASAVREKPSFSSSHGAKPSARGQTWLKPGRGTRGTRGTGRGAWGVREACTPSGWEQHDGNGTAMLTAVGYLCAPTVLVTAESPMMVIIVIMHDVDIVPVRAILAPSGSDSSSRVFSLPRATRRAAAAPARRTPTCVERQQGPRGTPCGEGHVARSTWHGACGLPTQRCARSGKVCFAWHATARTHRGWWEAGGGEAPGDRLADHGLGSQVDCKKKNGLRSKMSKHKTMKSCTALSPRGLTRHARRLSRGTRRAPACRLLLRMYE